MKDFPRNLIHHDFERLEFFICSKSLNSAVQFPFLAVSFNFERWLKFLGFLSFKVQKKKKKKNCTACFQRSLQIVRTLIFKTTMDLAVNKIFQHFYYACEFLRFLFLNKKRKKNLLHDVKISWKENIFKSKRKFRDLQRDQIDRRLIFFLQNYNLSKYR